MRAADLWRLAMRSLRHGWAAAYAVTLMLGTVCFYFSGAIWLTVHNEKQEPCELTVGASSYANVTEQAVQKLLEIDDVIEATCLLEVRVTISAGKYTASMTLLGIDPNYLTVDFVSGNVFAQSSAMPWLLLSEDAIKQFVDPSDLSVRDTDYAPDVDWLNADITLTVGEKSVVAGVSGIYSDDGNSSSGYIALSVAKKLLQEQGSSAKTTAAAVRITNIGAAQSVTRQITALGYEVVNANDALQEKWDGQEKEMVYLLLLGIMTFVCAALMKSAETKRDLQSRQSQYQAMQWMGFARAKQKQMFFWRTVFLDGIGVLLGVMVSCLIPIFLPATIADTSIFSFNLPVIETMAVAVLCVILASLSSRYLSAKQA